MDLKIGVLIPQSFIYPLFPQQIIKSLKLGFETAGINPQFVIEDIGKAVAPEVVIGKANNLLMEDVNITIAYVGKKVEESLKTLYNAAQKPLILMGVGACVVREEERGRPPYVFANSLDVWQSCYLLGQYAAEKYGKNAVASVGLLEAGYNFLPVLNESYELNGGKITCVHTSKKMDDIDFTEAFVGILEQHKPDFMVEFYSGIDSDKFYKLMVTEERSNLLPIVTTGLGAEPFQKADYPVVHGLSWHPAINNKANLEMLDAFKQKLNAIPNPYQVLCYETAMAIVHSVKMSPAGVFSDANFCEQLGNIEFEGPRGWFSINKETNSNNPFPTIIADKGEIITMELPNEKIVEIEEEHRKKMQSGWFNPYPCA